MDKNVIEEIKRKYDLNKDEDVLALYRAIQSGEYVLDSAQGKRLDDEIYDRAMEIKQKRAAQKKEGADASKKRKAAKQKKQKGKKVVVLSKGQYVFRKSLSIVLLLAAVLCLGYFGYYCYEAYQTRAEQERLARLKQNEAVNSMYDDLVIKKHDEVKNEEIKLQILDEYKSLYSQNKNLIGWLKIADTNIDYPVMQTADNSFYLNHSIDLKEDKNGTLFLDAACDFVKPSTNLIIYGHNMRSGNMFGSLDKYKSESYYKKHPTIEFDTLYEKGQYEIAFAFNSHIYTENEIAFKYYQFIDAATQKEFESNINAMYDLSLYDTGVVPVYGDELLTLSTCDYEESNGRFVVVARRIQ